MDVFFCSAPTTDERRLLAGLCLDWWKEEHFGEFHVLTPEIIGCSVAEFNRERRIYADQMAKGDHIVTDDDCIPICDLSEAHEVFSRYPDFGTLSLWPVESTIYPWTEIEALEDAEVMEHVSVGGIRFCRKGMPFPPSETAWYDRTHADTIRAIGKKVGLFKNYKMNHLGDKRSTLSANQPQ